MFLQCRLLRTIAAVALSKRIALAAVVALAATASWAVAASPAPAPQDYVLTPEQKLILIPAEARASVEAAMKTIPWQESVLAKLPSLTFTSGESRGGGDERVLNRIHYFPRGRFDIWLMKQSVAGRAADLRRWNRIAIAVDRKARPYRAYYFQFGTEDRAEKGMPPYKAFTARCLNCHASGPRVIRPEQTQWTRPFSPTELTRLKEWNWRISGYREVVDYSPRWNGARLLEEDASSERAALLTKSCAECHHAGSGVRGTLLRQHADSILYLTGHFADAKGIMSAKPATARAEMPMEEAALGALQTRCLSAWIKQEPLAKDCPAN